MFGLKGPADCLRSLFRTGPCRHSFPVQDSLCMTFLFPTTCLRAWRAAAIVVAVRPHAQIAVERSNPSLLLGGDCPSCVRKACLSPYVSDSFSFLPTPSTVQRAQATGQGTRGETSATQDCVLLGESGALASSTSEFHGCASCSAELFWPPSMTAHLPSTSLT